MTDAIIVGDKTYTVPTGAKLLTSMSHPIFGTQEAHFNGTAPIPDGLGVVAAAQIASTNNTTQTGSAQGQLSPHGSRSVTTVKVR